MCDLCWSYDNKVKFVAKTISEMLEDYGMELVVENGEIHVMYVNDKLVSAPVYPPKIST
jgi:hypothetical protein